MQFKQSGEQPTAHTGQCEMLMYILNDMGLCT